ncbi:MAG: hypothetical protein KGJ49_13365 [Alphaproteobacteria bacterium]|nr:hypothetical protein [Alphaproteobacteria bacterium]
MLRRLFEYLTLADYDAANEQANRKIVARFTRGNIYLKNGLYMTRSAMDAQSERGGRAVARLQKKVAS